MMLFQGEIIQINKGQCWIKSTKKREDNLQIKENQEKVLDLKKLTIKKKKVG